MQFYQKIRDIYALAVDYDPAAEETRKFFRIVQNNLVVVGDAGDTAARSVDRSGERVRHHAAREGGVRGELHGGLAPSREHGLADVFVLEYASDDLMDVPPVPLEGREADAKPEDLRRGLT